MRSLEIEFTGLCLFVPDASARTVHVLMPSVPAGGGSDRYVTRLLHPSFAEPEGRPLEGWALVLGTLPGTADIILEPAGPGTGKIVDLSRLTGETIDRPLLEDAHTPQLASRVTLHAGAVTRVEARRSAFTVGGQVVAALRKVTWRIDDVPDELNWISIGADGPPPLRSLAHLPQESGEPIRLRVYHGPAHALPPKNEPIGGTEVRRHFEIVCRLLGIEHLSETLLPIPRPSKALAKLYLAMVLPGDDDTDDW